MKDVGKSPNDKSTTQLVLKSLRLKVGGSFCHATIVEIDHVRALQFGRLEKNYSVYIAATSQYIRLFTHSNKKTLEKKFITW